MKRDRLGNVPACLSLAVAAVCLTAVFIVLALRHKSVWQALLAVVAAGSASAALLLLCDACDREDASDAGELFEGEAVEEADRRAREALAGDN